MAGIEGSNPFRPIHHTHEIQFLQVALGDYLS
jgi:hypothetical protein